MLIAGKYDATAETVNDKINIINIEKKLISLGSFSKKYISGGKISKLNTEDKIILIFSILCENRIPKMIPLIVAKKPMEKPVKEKEFFIELLLSPKVFKIAISLVLFFINIVNPDIILNAATITISVNIINITFLSTFRALKSDLFKSDQV